MALRVGLELVILTFLVNFALGAGIVWLWMSRARESFDLGLEGVGRAVSARIDTSGPSPLGWPFGEGVVPDLNTDPRIIVVRGPGGDVLQSVPPTAPPVPFTPLTGTDPVLSTIEPGALAALLPGGRVRMFTAPGREGTTVQVLMSQGQLDELGKVLRLVFYFVIPPLTACATLIAWSVASRRLARLRQISGLAHEIEPSQLDRRLRISHANDELDQLSEEVNRMLARLEGGFQAQERFINDVSHELKTPVSVLLLEAQVLARSPGTGPVHAEFILSVEEEMRRFSKLIESFLTVARAGHGGWQARRVPVDVNEAVLDASQHCRQLARLREARLEVRLPTDNPEGGSPVIDGDPDLFRTMVENLLRNAVASTPRRSTIDLCVSNGPGAVMISVRDRGAGVPHDLAAILAGNRAKSAGNKSDGLGLRIAKGIAELHAGSIHCRNVPREEGGGAEFSVRVPLAAG